MSLEKIKIGNAIYDVISIAELDRDPSAFDPAYTAVKWTDGNIYPVKTLNKLNCAQREFVPGYYMTDCMDFIVPAKSDEYSESHIINFRDPNLRNVIAAQQRLMNAERTILTTVDNLFAPEITDSDTPEMKAMKEAITDKHIDLDKYEPRFGPNYNNDKRLLRKNNITFGKLRAICDALDMRATLTIQDANPDVPNPIGRVIVAELTGGSTDTDIIDTEEV